MKYALRIPVASRTARRRPQTFYDNSDGFPVTDDLATARKRILYSPSRISRSYSTVARFSIIEEGREDALEVSGAQERVIPYGPLRMERLEGQTIPDMSLATSDRRIS